ncbi:glycosyltransferase family 39 protein [Streptomyces sp. NPDC020192]|uniref:glycosyltransferase family 39 protein n=1 Tax=Streptomyces sp. NPDC020192 TaxID=3365066 RepID=UPI0037B88573
MSTSSPLRRSDRPRGTGRPAVETPPGVLRALALFAVVRLAGVAVVVAVDAIAGRPFGKSLAHAWDSVWYLHIAEHGYGTQVRITSTGAVQTDWAFFPLYPGLIRALSDLVHLTAGQAGVLIAWTCALIAAYGIYAIGHHLYGQEVATALVALWAVLPHAVVLGLAYTEPLFTACAAWALYAVLKGRWAAAGALALLAGLSRPSGIAAAAAVTGAALYEAVRRRGRVPRGLWAGAALGPLGWTGYVLWVGGQTGDLLHGYFRVQSAWKSQLDLSVGPLRILRSMPLDGTGPAYPMAVLVVLAATLLFCLLCLERAPLPLVVFAGVLLLLVLAMSGPFSSRPRFLLPAFPLLIPAARALTTTWHTHRHRARVLYGTLTTVSLLYGAYLATLAPKPL